ncbi:MAG: hypothetical protein LUC85_02080 [Bacteroidales bacterium]|nr:hypothetical protein [Bacteroidales bacterium]
MIVISLSTIEKTIYAVAALRSHYSRRRPETIPLLTRDHGPALRLLAVDAVAHIAQRIGVLATFDGDEQVTLSLDSNDLTFSRLIHHAAAMLALSTANVGYDPQAVDDYAAKAESLIDQLPQPGCVVVSRDPYL